MLVRFTTWQLICCSFSWSLPLSLATVPFLRHYPWLHHLHLSLPLEPIFKNCPWITLCALLRTAPRLINPIVFCSPNCPYYFSRTCPWFILVPSSGFFAPGFLMECTHGFSSPSTVRDRDAYLRTRHRRSASPVGAVHPNRERSSRSVSIEAF